MRVSSSRFIRFLVAVLFAGGLLATYPSTPASAHTAVISDPDDTAGPLDIRRETVTHKDDQVIHRIETYGRWTTHSLGHDSYFEVLLDISGTRKTFERCALIFQRYQLTGRLTNCKSIQGQTLHVEQIDAKTVTISIPDDHLPGHYHYAVASAFFGDGGCSKGCIDVAPNRYPLPLHDLTPPAVTFTGSHLVSDNGTSLDLSVGFDVTDRGGAGLRAWTLSADGPVRDGYEVVDSGTSKSGHWVEPSPVEGATYWYRVEASDRHDNVTTADSYVSVPWDDASLDSGGAFTGTWSATSDPSAFLGTLHSSSETAASFEIPFTTEAKKSTAVVWVGPGGGSWSASTKLSCPSTTKTDTVIGSSTAVGPRTRLYAKSISTGFASEPCTFTITVLSGGPVPIDAIGLSTRP
jgi:hypothetical protein